MNTPYMEKMLEQLNQLSLTPIHECAGSDISNLADLRKTVSGYYSKPIRLKLPKRSLSALLLLIMK